ncbi:hypothetical protein P7H15_19915 [Paenibacillus larvae]|nr:hypothetical protein [Paenibacillus larvae]MDT2294618.1 hypothetical protein [Paenibacillus larvae]
METAFRQYGVSLECRKFTDWGWMVKIENHTLTVDELVWLNNHIWRVVYKVDGYEKSDTRRG